MPELQGPRLEPRSRPPSALIVFLHGYGANGEDLIALGAAWQSKLPGVAAVAPNAPETIPGLYGGFQWFPLTFGDPSEFRRGVVAAQPILESYLDAELIRYGLGPERLVLVGFSQGAMLALHVGLRRPVAPAAIVGYSGLLPGPDHLEAEIKARPPILLVHGELDDLIPVAALHAAREALARHGLAVEWHVRPGLGHGIDMVGQELGASFIARILRERALA
jgi:phospholipase/carboxylesterase